jgi:hypothetical protein
MRNRQLQAINADLHSSLVWAVGLDVSDIPESGTGLLIHRPGSLSKRDGIATKGSGYEV